MQAPCYPFIHSDDGTTGSVDDLRIFRAADCPAQPVEWLWPGRIPIGKVTLLVGDPGAGKSLIALDIAARLSRGADWPDTNDETRMTNDESSDHSSFDIRHSSLPTSPCSTLILSAEDDLADTIRPRLDAAGADPRRVFVIPSIADLRHDFAQLRAAVNRAPNCRLIVVDPINAYVGPADSHFQTIVRKVLAPLAEFATEKRIAVLAIAHLRKNDGAAIHRAAGSMGFVASARAVWTVCRDPANPGRQLFLPIKNNLSSAACGLAYTIQPNTLNAAPAITWNPAPISTSAEKALAPAAKNRGPEAVELNDASEWLRRALAGGPQPASQLIEYATQIGFHKRTLRRALHVIGGNAQKRGLLEGWWWALVAETEISTPSGAMPTAASEQGNPEKLVLFPETRPLPEIFNEETTKAASSPTGPPTASPSLHPPPVHEPLAMHRTISQSISALEARDRKQPGALRRSEKVSNRRRRSPSKTGNPLLDQLLDEFRKPLHPQTKPP